MTAAAGANSSLEAPANSTTAAPANSTLLSPATVRTILMRMLPNASHTGIRVRVSSRVEANLVDVTILELGEQHTLERILPIVRTQLVPSVALAVGAHVLVRFTAAPTIITMIFPAPPPPHVPLEQPQPPLRPPSMPPCQPPTALPPLGASTPATAPPANMSVERAAEQVTLEHMGSTIGSTVGVIVMLVLLAVSLVLVRIVLCRRRRASRQSRIGVRRNRNPVVVATKDTTVLVKAVIIMLSLRRRRKRGERIEIRRLDRRMVRVVKRGGSDTGEDELSGSRLKGEKTSMTRSVSGALARARSQRTMERVAASRRPSSPHKEIDLADGLDDYLEVRRKSASVDCCCLLSGMSHGALRLAHFSLAVDAICMVAGARGAGPRRTRGERVGKSSPYVTLSPSQTVQPSVPHHCPWLLQCECVSMRGCRC